MAAALVSNSNQTVQVTLQPSAQNSVFICAVTMCRAMTVTSLREFEPRPLFHYRQWIMHNGGIVHSIKHVQSLREVIDPSKTGSCFSWFFKPFLKIIFAL